MSSKQALIAFAAAILLLVILEVWVDVPAMIYWSVGLFYAAVNIWGTVSVSSQFFLPVKYRGNASGGAIAITFDDGPVPKNTERVLKILTDMGVKATFFCIGKNVQAHPQLVKKIYDEGHIIGNHSYLHGSLFDLQPSGKMKNELVMTNSIVHEIVGVEPRYFRPPYGVTNPNLASAVRQVNLVAVGWSVRSLDTVTREGKQLFNTVTRNLKAGDIILFHDRCEITIEILPQLLNHIQRMGLKIEPLDKIIGEQPYA